MSPMQSERTSTVVKSNDDNDSTNDDDDDDVVVLWKKLQETQHKKMKQLKEETEKLQHEKDTMMDYFTSKTGTNNIRDDDIITINAGGKLITALRSTLTLPTDSMWSFMFSGRWEESLKRDSDGCIFLDHNHEVIEIIVNYLREKKIEDPSNPLSYPFVPPHKEKSFQRLLGYFGLREFFKLDPLLDFSDYNFVQYGSAITMTASDDKSSINFVHDSLKGIEDSYGLACSTELDPSGEGSFWKVKINKTLNYRWLFIGIIGNLSIQNYRSEESTSFGWTTYETVVYNREDVLSDGEWTEFDEGECLYFRFKAKKLSMHSVQKDQTFAIDDIDTNATKFHIHFNFLGDESLTLESLGAEEREIFTDND